MALYRTILSSPVGPLTLVAGDRGLTAVLWPGDDTARVRVGITVDDPDHPLLRAAKDQLGAYFAGRRRSFDLPLDTRGTPFQESVWTALRAIPFGQTRSYAAIAVMLGRPAAVRAVGAANGRNPLSIVIPCHRVVGSNGALTGFAGGLETKRMLLAWEAATIGERDRCR